MHAAEAPIRPTPFSRRRFTSNAKTALTAEIARQLIEYDPVGGAMVWRESPRYGIAAGATVGVQIKRGYIAITLLGFKYTGHRLAWLLHYGSWPTQVIDHINGVKSDNRICNLRDVSQAVNLKNRRRA